MAGSKSPALVALDPREVLRELHRAGWQSRLYELKTGGEPVRALIRGVQFHPVTDNPIHVDFQRLVAGERIKVAVPVHFENDGISPGLKRGGMLNVVRHAVEVYCDADNIPDQFTADLAQLDFNDNVRWHDLRGPRTRGAVIDRDFVVATVVAPTKVEEAAAARGRDACRRRTGQSAGESARQARADPAGPGFVRWSSVTGKHVMLLWVGLGNPEPGMARNRHNIGFMALDVIAIRHGFSPWRRRFKGLTAEGSIGGEKILALKPLTYMNASGEAVQAAAAFYKLPPDAITAFHDELDLVPGKLRVKFGGGTAGHNGLRSLDRQLGTAEFLARAHGHWPSGLERARAVLCARRFLQGRGGLAGAVSGCDRRCGAVARIGEGAGFHDQGGAADSSRHRP